MNKNECETFSLFLIGADFYCVGHPVNNIYIGFPAPFGENMFSQPKITIFNVILFSVVLLT